jgi:hypothetical protein
MIHLVEESGYDGAVAWNVIAPTDIAHSDQGAVNVVNPAFKNSEVGIATLFNPLLPVVLLHCIFGNFVKQFDGRLLLFSRNSWVHEVLPVKESIVALQLTCYWVSAIFQFNQLEEVYAELGNSEKADAHCCLKENFMAFFFNGCDWKQKDGRLKNSAQEHLVVSCHFD